MSGIFTSTLLSYVYVSHTIQFRTVDDFVLDFLAEFYEKGGVSCNADDEVAILSGMLLGGPECFVIDAVELHLSVAQQ